MPACVAVDGRAWPAWLLLLYLMVLAVMGWLLERINDRRVAKMIDRAPPAQPCSRPLLVGALLSAVGVVVLDRRELVAPICFGAVALGSLRAAAAQVGRPALPVLLIAGLVCLLATGLSFFLAPDAGRSWLGGAVVGVSCTAAGVALNRRLLWAPRYS